MTATKSPISLDPLIASDGAPGHIRWAFVQTLHKSATVERALYNHVRSSTGAGPVRSPRRFIPRVSSMRPEKLQGRGGRICAPMVHNERTKREMAPSWRFKSRHVLKCNPVAQTKSI